MEDVLGEAPSLPMDLATFLGGYNTDKQNDAPHHSAPSIAGALQLPCDNGHQCCPTHTGEAPTKTTAKAMAAI